MVSPSYKLALCAAVLSLNLQCARQPGALDAPQQTDAAQEQDDSMTDKQSEPIVTKGRATLIRFPDYWAGSEARGESKFLAPLWYEIRKASNSPERELLFAGMTTDGYWGEIYADRTGEKPKDSWYSINLYAVSLDDTSRVRAASKQEWDSAEKVSLRPKQVFPNSLDDSKLEAFDYRGRKYPKAGEHWGGALLSPGGRWLAVYSYSGEKTQGNFLGGDTPREGGVYWDVYDVNTGEKVLSWHAESVYGPGVLKEGAVWVGEEYFVMPLSSALQECVIGILSDQ
jgi:hypothetical protein